jgi:hypothetical protein
MKRTLLDFFQCRDRLVHDLLHRHELDVVTQHDVQMIGAEAVQRHVHALRHALRGKIKMREVVASEFRAEGVAFARHALQRDAKQHLAHAASVEWRCVDEVQPALERDAHALHRLVELHAAELRAERRCAEAEDGKLEAGFS